MTNITKHDSEQEREGNDSEETWIDFLVGSNTVTIHDRLEAFGELIRAMEGWRLLGRLQFMQNWRNISSRLLLKVGSAASP